MHEPGRWRGLFERKAFQAIPAAGNPENRHKAYGHPSAHGEVQSMCKLKKEGVTLPLSGVITSKQADLAYYVKEFDGSPVVHWCKGSIAKPRNVFLAHRGKVLAKGLMDGKSGEALHNLARKRPEILEQKLENLFVESPYVGWFVSNGLAEKGFIQIDADCLPTP